MPAKPAESESGEPVKPDPSAESDQENDAFQYMDFIPSFREQVSCYGEDRFALRAVLRPSCSPIGAMPSRTKPTARRPARPGSAQPAQNLGPARCPGQVLPGP